MMVNSHGYKCHFCRSRLHLYKRCPLYERLEIELAANVGINRVDYGGSIRWVHSQTGLFSSQLTDLVDFGWLLDANSRIWSTQRDSRGLNVKLPPLPLQQTNTLDTSSHVVEMVNTPQSCVSTTITVQPEVCASSEIQSRTHAAEPEPSFNECKETIHDPPDDTNSVDSDDSEEEPDIVTWNDPNRISCPRTEIIVAGLSVPAVLDSNCEVSIMSYRTYDNLVSNGCPVEHKILSPSAQSMIRDPADPHGTNSVNEMIQCHVHINGRTIYGWFLLKFRNVPRELIERRELDECVVGRNLLRR